MSIGIQITKPYVPAFGPQASKKESKFEDSKQEESNENGDVN